MATDLTPQKKENPKPLKEFFETALPGRLVPVEFPSDQDYTITSSKTLRVKLPFLKLYCPDSCNGMRLSEPSDLMYPIRGRWSQHFVRYRCRNCGEATKIYAVQSRVDTNYDFNVRKVGEYPLLGPPTPARVITLVGKEKDYFLKGRRAELQGLGIGAFAYYRRVIENQKDRIFDEIIRVCERLKSDKELINELAIAKTETQFSRAVQAVKHGIPEVLFINGQNPLTLLHSALSQGLHEQTDDACLELATSIRVILTKFVERVAPALKDEKNLEAVVKQLIRARGPKQNKSSK